MKKEELDIRAPLLRTDYEYYIKPGTGEYLVVVVVVVVVVTVVVTVVVFLELQTRGNLAFLDTKRSFLS